MIWWGAAVVLLLAAWLFKLSLLSYALYATVAVLVLSRALARNWTTNVKAKRETSAAEAEIGDSVSVMVSVENKGAIPVAWMLLEDLLPREALRHNPPDLQIMGSRIQLAMLAGRAKKTVIYRLGCNRRGYFQVGPLLMETGDLFGLHRRHRVAAPPHFVLVLPKVIPLVGYDVSSRRPIGEVRMTYRLYEDPTRIAGVRRYEAGDPLNRVHWRATARTGVLHSKVYEPSTVAGATLLLDMHAASHQRGQGEFRAELAITTAASLASALAHMGQQFGLVSNGRDAADRVRTEGWDVDLQSRVAIRKATSVLEKSDRLRPVVVDSRRGAEHLPDLLRALARLELTDGLNLPQLLHECEGRMPRDATVVAVLPMPTVESCVALEALKKQGYAVTAIVNVYEEDDFAAASVPLLAANIETRHLKDEESIAAICRQFALR